MLVLDRTFCAKATFPFLFYDLFTCPLLPENLLIHYNSGIIAQIILGVVGVLDIFICFRKKTQFNHF